MPFFGKNTQLRSISNSKNRQYQTHPFTAPFPEHVDLLETKLLEIKAQAYDLILNGIELVGGSIRIHQRSVQQRTQAILEDAPSAVDEEQLKELSLRLRKV